MKTMFALFCALGASLASMAQEKSFDLSQYKFPDYKRHQLDFSLNSNGSSNSWSDTNYDGASRFVNSTNTSGLNLNYKFIYSTRKRIETLNSSFYGSYYSAKSDSYSGKSTLRSPDASFSIDASETYYLTENKWFLEADPQFYSDFSSTINHSTGQDKLKNEYSSINGSLGLGAGYGRIENVTELWQAYYILEGLKKQGLLARESSTDDAYKLAALASLLKNKRFFDFRIKKMEEMKSLDSLMHRSGLIENTDIAYFNILNDYWSFATVSNRMSGRTIKFLLTPYVSHYFSKQYSGEKQTQNLTSLSTALDFQCKKQMNLFWERAFSLHVANVTKLNSDKLNGYDYPKNSLQVYSTFALNYYPNFRTQVKTALEYYAWQYPDKLNLANTTYLNSWSNNLNLSENLYYYISPQLRAQATVGLNYVDQLFGSAQKDKVSLSYNLGFNYAIF